MTTSPVTRAYSVTRSSVRAIALASAIAVAALLAAPAQTAWGAASDTRSTADAAPDAAVAWGVRPADTAQGTGRPNFAYELLPGGTLRDGIVVTNRGTEPITLDLYAADGFLTSDGSLDILASGTPSTELGSWVDLASDDVTLAGGESAEVPFDVTVPSTVQPGDYTAGIVASLRVESEDGIVTERRLGSRVHLRIVGDLAPGIAVTDVRVDYEGVVNPLAGGTATVTLTLANTGNARILPSGTVAIAGPFGLTLATSSLADVPELLPGSSIDQVVELGGVAPLFLAAADVTVGGDVVQRVGDTAAVPSVAAASATAATWAVPWTALGIVLLVAGAIVLSILVRRRSRAAHQRAVDDAVVAALAARDAEAAPRTDAEHPAPADGAAPTDSSDESAHVERPRVDSP